MFNIFSNSRFKKISIWIFIIIMLFSFSSCKKDEFGDNVDSSQKVTLVADSFENGKKVVTVKNGEYYRFPEATKDHYELLCWNYDGKEVKNSEIWNIRADVTLTPKWTPKIYSLSYNLNGGYQSKKMIGYTIESDTFTLITPQRNGYLFVGWNGTDVNGVERIVRVESGSFGNRSYTANWREVITEGIQYEIIGEEAVVIGFYSSDKEIKDEIILENYEYEGKVYPVTAIIDCAFADMGEFAKTLYIPSSIKNIGENAFFNTNINIQNN